MSHSTFDVIVVGAGPTGLSCAIECQTAGFRVLVLEKGALTNSIYHFPSNMTFFTTPDLLEIGGIPFTSIHPKPTREEGLQYYKRVAQYFQLNIQTGCRVERVEQAANVFQAQAVNDAGEICNFTSRVVIIATGYYDNANLLNIPGEDLAKVTHYYGDPHRYFDKDVLIIGGKNSAVIAALELHRYGARVTVVHRGAEISQHVKYWLLPDFLNRVKEGAFPMHLNTVVTRIEPRSVTLVDSRSNEETILQNDYVLALTGYRPDAEFLRRCGIEVDTQTLVPEHDQQSLETNIPGLFVAGSISSGAFTNALFIENGRHHGAAIVEYLQNH